MKILPRFDACIHTRITDRVTTLRKILRRPRGDSVDAHVSLTRSMAAHDCRWLFFLSFPSLSFIRERSRGKNNEAIDGIKYLKRWESAVIHCRVEKKILHGIKCVEHDEITNGGQGRVIEKNPLLIIYLSLDRCDYPSLFHSLCCVNLTLLQNFTRLKFW